MFSMSLLAFAGLTGAATLPLPTSIIPIPDALQGPSTDGFSNPVPHMSNGGNAVCVSGTIPVKASVTQNTYDYSLPENQTVVTETFLDYITPGQNFLDGITTGSQDVSGTYKISATLCTPKDNTTPNGVQLLTHGIGFDRYYWDFTSDYSYVDRAAEAGYASFFYDRLGVGKSQKADPIDVVQAPLEVEIARNFVTMLRNGEIASNEFEKVVGVGHSFGSISKRLQVLQRYG